MTKKTISKAKPAAKPAKLKSGAAIKDKARPIAHKKVKPEPKKPEAKKVPVKPVKLVAKPAPKIARSKVADKGADETNNPAVKRVEEVKKPVAKPEPCELLLGKELLIRSRFLASSIPRRRRTAPPAPSGAAARSPTDKEESDAPLLDLSDAAVRKMITRAKQRGYVTYDELNRVLPSDKVSSEQIEDTMAMLNEMGINVIESEEQEEGEGAEVPAVAAGRQVAEVSEKAEETYDRTDDPVRMYLREMGSVELLSREGEIAIAKRIEAGRELMIGALCEGPLTFEALTVWRDELNEGKALLRDIIDLEAMYGGVPGAEHPAACRVPRRFPASSCPVRRPVPSAAPNGARGCCCSLPRQAASRRCVPARCSRTGAAPQPKPQPPKAARRGRSRRRREARRRGRRRHCRPGRRFRRREQSVALGDGSRAEAAGLATLDQIAALYKRLGKLQDAQVEAALGADELSTSQERRFNKLRNETVDLVKSLRLNNNRIEALVDQMYGINRRLLSLEGKLLAAGRSARRRSHRFPQAVFRQRARSQLAAPRGTSDRLRLEGIRARRARQGPRAARRDPDARAGDPPVDLRFPPHRADGAEGRARSRVRRRRR